MSVSPPGFNPAPSVVPNPYPPSNSLNVKNKYFPVDWVKYEQSKSQINRMGKRLLNTENTTGLALTVGMVFGLPLLKTAKMIKSNAVLDYLSKAGSFWGLLYLENGLVNDAIKKQIEYSGPSFNIFRRAE